MLAPEELNKGEGNQFLQWFILTKVDQQKGKSEKKFKETYLRLTLKALSINTHVTIKFTYLKTHTGNRYLSTSQSVS